MSYLISFFNLHEKFEGRMITNLPPGASCSSRSLGISAAAMNQNRFREKQPITYLLPRELRHKARSLLVLSDHLPQR